LATSRLAADDAFRVLCRAGYGPRPGQAAALARQGLPGWVEAQLALPVAEPVVEAAIDQLRIPIRYGGKDGERLVAEARPPTTLRQPLPALYGLMENAPEQRAPGAERERPRLELALATLVRKVSAEGQLRERLVEFWHDHFNVALQAGPRVVVALPDHDRRIRAEALGNFRVLLEAVATSPAMLAFLNNQSSRAGAPNENYARELLELHTLGRAAYFGAARSAREVPALPEGGPAGYVDADVWEAARAFTGWSIAAGQRFDGERSLPKTGEFSYVAPWHDNYQKRFLGRDLDPFAPAMADGRAVLDALAAHPATARFVCGKLVAFLIGGPAPAAVARAEAAWRQHRARPDQIAQVVRATLDGPEVADPRQGRIRRPLDAVVAGARAYDLPFTPTRQLLGQMEAAGQTLFGWPAPDGQPIDAAPYLGASALRMRWTTLTTLTRALEGAPLGAELAEAPVGTVVGRLATLALGPSAAPAARAIGEAWAAAGGNPNPSLPEVASLAGWVLAAPAFLST